MVQIFLSILLLCSTAFAEEYSGAYREGSFVATVANDEEGVPVPQIPVMSYMTHYFCNGVNFYDNQPNNVAVGDSCLLHVVVHTEDIEAIRALPTYLGVGHAVRETDAYQSITGTDEAVWLYYEDEYAYIDE